MAADDDQPVIEYPYLLMQHCRWRHDPNLPTGCMQLLCCAAVKARLRCGLLWRSEHDAAIQALGCGGFQFGQQVDAECGSSSPVRGDHVDRTFDLLFCRADCADEEAGPSLAGQNMQVGGFYSVNGIIHKASFLPVSVRSSLCMLVLPR